MTSLYGTIGEILGLEYVLRQLEEKGEDYEGASDDIAQFLVTAKEEKLAEKVDAYVHVVRDKEAIIKARKAEIQHLKKMNRAETNTIKRLKEAAKWASKQLDRPKFKGLAHTITVSTSKKPAAIDVIDKWAVPAEFSEPVPDVKIDKKAILAHLLETGEIVSGVEARKVTKVMFR